MEHSKPTLQKKDRGFKKRENNENNVTVTTLTHFTNKTEKGKTNHG